jgi:uncharacterized protein YpmS
MMYIVVMVALLTIFTLVFAAMVISALIDTEAVLEAKREDIKQANRQMTPAKLVTNEYAQVG